MLRIQSIILSVPQKTDRETTAATVVLHTSSSRSTFPLSDISCIATPRGVISTDLLWQLKGSTLPKENLDLYLWQKLWVSIFFGTAKSRAMSDGRSAVKAKRQQIHLLSSKISLCNWRQFVSFQCQQIWKHDLKEPLGKETVCVVTKFCMSL